MGRSSDDLREIDAAELNHAVVNVSARIGDRGPCKIEKVGVDACRSKRVDLCQYLPGTAVELPYFATETRHVNEVIGENSMEHGFPAAQETSPWIRHRLPVARVAPLLDKLSSLPMQPALIPDLETPTVRAADRLTRRRISGIGVTGDIAAGL